MLLINLLNPNPVSGEYVATLRQLSLMVAPEASNFEASNLIETARDCRDRLEELEVPCRKLTGAISLFEDLAADRMLKPEIARSVLERVGKDPGAVLIPGFHRFEPVGFGGFGVVYWALNEDTGMSAAVKVGRLTPKGASTDSLKRADTVERLREVFESEYRMMRKIDSDRVVRAHAMGYTDRGKPFILMDFVDGGNLFRRLRRIEGGEIPFSWEIISPMILQVLEAAAVLHENGIIHNDIKPENYLTTRDGQLKLSDFSFATTIEQAQKHGARGPRGTAGHLALQSVETPVKDVYALGSTIYQILTGQTPVKQQDAGLGALAAFLYGSPPPSQRRPNRHIPPELDRFVMKALDRRPTNRFKSAVEMLAAFKRLQRLLVDGSAPSSSVRPTRRPSRAPIIKTGGESSES